MYESGDGYEYEGQEPHCRIQLRQVLRVCEGSVCGEELSEYGG